MTLSSTVIRKQYSYIVTNSRWLLPVEQASALEASKRLGDKSILLGESDASLLQPTLGQQPRRAAVHPGTVLVGKKREVVGPPTPGTRLVLRVYVPGGPSREEMMVCDS